MTLHSKPASPNEELIAYDPPCIELVLTADELEREVLYAGASSSPK